MGLSKLHISWLRWKYKQASGCSLWSGRSLASYVWVLSAVENRGVSQNIFSSSCLRVILTRCMNIVHYLRELFPNGWCHYMPWMHNTIIISIWLKLDRFLGFNQLKPSFVFTHGSSLYQVTFNMCVFLKNQNKKNLMFFCLFSCYLAAGELSLALTEPGDGYLTECDTWCSSAIRAGPENQTDFQGLTPAMLGPGAGSAVLLKWSSSIGLFCFHTCTGELYFVSWVTQMEV